MCTAAATLVASKSLRWNRYDGISWGSGPSLMQLIRGTEGHSLHSSIPTAPQSKTTLRTWLLPTSLIRTVRVPPGRHVRYDSGQEDNNTKHYHTPIPSRGKHNRGVIKMRRGHSLLVFILTSPLTANVRATTREESQDEDEQAVPTSHLYAGPKQTMLVCLLRHSFLESLP